MAFLRTELELCFTFASLAEKISEIRYHEKAKRYVAHAEKGYSIMFRLLSDPRLSMHPGNPEVRELLSGIYDLRRTLDRLKQG
jgi:hypothetical protein